MVEDFGVSVGRVAVGGSGFRALLRPGGLLIVLISTYTRNPQPKP